MALVLQQLLASNSSGLGAGWCCRPLKTLSSTGGVSAVVGERPSVNVRRLTSVPSQVGRRGSKVTALLLQQTSGTSSSPAQKAPHLPSCEDGVSQAKVFEDEAQGICCYRAPSGEVTCEGYDEGPHFQPAASCNEKAAEAKSLNCESSSMEEGFSYKYVMGGQGKCWCEGKDEC